MIKSKTSSLHKAIDYAKRFGYSEVINSIGETFTLKEFYKKEGNSRGWLVIPNIAGKDAKMVKYVDFGRRYRIFTLRTD